MPLTTRPNTVCLLSSHGVGTVVMKNCSVVQCWEPEWEVHTAWHCAEVNPTPSAFPRPSHLAAVSAGTGVCHGEREGAIVTQALVKLILKLATPDGLAACTITQWVASLYHEALNNAMKDDAVVVTIPCMRREVLHCARALDGGGWKKGG